MHKRGSHGSVELRLWQNIPEWYVAKVQDNLWAARIGYAVTEPREQIAYEDEYVKLSVFNAETKPVLGYTLLAKKQFNIVKRDWYLTLIDPGVTQHHSPTTVFNDAQVFLRKFNGAKDSSYWMILRCRTT